MISTIETHLEVPFEIEFEYTPAEIETRNCPGCPADWSVCEVKLFGVYIPWDNIPSDVHERIMDAIGEHVNQPQPQDEGDPYQDNEATRRAQGPEINGLEY